MSRRFRHVRLAGAALALLAGTCLVGPWVLPDPPPADPANGALIRPLATVGILTLDDGTTRVARGGATPPEGRVAARTTHTYLLGTDRFGRDVLHRLLLGGRVSLGVATCSLVIAMVIGLGVGLAAGTGPRWLDAVLMRILDAWMAFPALFLLILLVALFRPGTASLVLVLGVNAWMGLARLTRGQVLVLREQPFLVASRAMGSPWHLQWRLHYVPNLVGPVSQEAALRLGDLVIAEATLSFLGLGVQPPTPSWGAMVAQGRSVLLDGWWLATLPGLAIAALVILLALLGDGLQHAMER